MTRKRAITGFGVTLCLILAITVFFYMNFRTVVVNGNSMEPTFISGQRLLASQAYWLVGPIKPKDVVVVKTDTDYIIKRVYKMAGEEVDYANVPEDFRLGIDGKYVVPENHVFLLGDNREVSEDSRKFGAIPVSRIIGKVVRR